MATRCQIVIMAVALVSAVSCTFSVGSTTRIGWDELRGVLLSTEDVPQYMTKTDEGVMRPERLQSPGRAGVETGYGILFEVPQGEGVRATPLKVVLSEAELYEDSEAAGEAIRIRPALIIEDSQKSGPRVVANEVEVGAIAEQANGVRLDMVDLNDVQYTILFRQGRILGSVLVVAPKDYGENELLQTGERLGRLMANRMQALLEKRGG
jgi:hypothetical protein